MKCKGASRGIINDCNNGDIQWSRTCGERDRKQTIVTSSLHWSNPGQLHDREKYGNEGVSRFQAKRVRKRSTRKNIARLVHLPLKFIQKLTESPFSQRSKFRRQAEGVFSRITKSFCSLVTTPSEVCRKFLSILAIATLPVRSSFSLFESYNFANGQSYVAKIK